MYIYAGEDLPETETQIQEELLIDISQTTNETQLQEIWNKNPKLHKDVNFIQAVTTRKKQIENGNK